MENSRARKKPFHEQVAERLIKQLEEGTAPWQKPWEGGGFMPENPTTGKRYKGINAVHLMSQGRGDNRWLTYKQAKGMDAQVRKGERGTAVQYWKFHEEKDKLDSQGKPVLDAKGKKVKVSVKLERPRVFMATVFNAEQIDGMPPLQKQNSYEWKPSERAEKILEASGANINIERGDRAFYRPLTDSIHLPEKDQFPTPDDFYRVAMHELGHWTGHQSRLDRDLAHPFGSQGYAKEELRAEISSMIMGEEIGIGHNPEQHAAYVGNWVKALKEDPMEIFRASADAEKIQTYILGLEQKYEQEQALSEAEKLEVFKAVEPVLQDALFKELDHWQSTVVASKEGKELSGVVHESDEFAEVERNTIAMDAKVLAEYRIGQTTKKEFDQRLGEMDSPKEWNGEVTVRPVKEFVDTNNDGQEERYIDQVPENEAEFWGLYTGYDNKPPMHLSDHHSKAEAMDSADGLKAAYELSVDYQKRLESLITEKQNQQQSTNHDQEANSKKDLEPQLFQLAPDKDAYGEQAEWWLVVSHDADDELSAPFPTQERAEQERGKIIAASTALADFRSGTVSGDQLSKITEKELGGTITYPESWNGKAEVKGIEYESHENRKSGDEIKFINQIPVEKAELYGVFSGHDGVDLDMFFSEHKTTTEAEDKAVLLKGIYTQANIYQQQLEARMSEQQGQAAEQAAEREKQAVRNPGSTEEDILAAKIQRADAESSLATATEKESGLLDQALKAADSPVPERTYINVPFKEKDEAKSLGARWDRGVESWFVPDSVDKTAFSKWPTQTKEQAQQKQQKGQQKKNTDRQYLAVPYEDRAKAKSDGALWDRGAKSWYVGPKANMDALKKWLPDNNQGAEQSPAMNPREEFSDTLKQLGFKVSGDHPIMDGSKQRVDVEGDRKGQSSGFYVGYLDGHPAGFAQNNKSGEQVKWKSKGYALTPEEKAKLQAEAAQKLQERKQQQEALHKQTSQRVTKQLQQQSPVVRATPYMESKQIKPDPEVYTGPDNKTTFIPAIDTEGKQWSTQYIQEDGTKRFAKDSRKDGCFHAVGGLDALAAAPALVIGEGYATAKTISEEIGFSTVAAFDAGNLPAVTKALHQMFPDKPVVIAADDDLAQELKKEGNNPGKNKAKEAAQAVGGRFVAPTFAPGEQAAEPKKFTDFNDLANNSKLGRDGVRRQVKAVVDRAIETQKTIQKEQLQERMKQQERKPRAVKI